MGKLILIINPGSTSTKYGIYDYNTGKMLVEKELLHSREELKDFEHITDQADFREKIILDALYKEGYKETDLIAIAARGGLLHPISGSVYKVNDDMVKDLRECNYGEHASNLGGIIGKKFMENYNIPAFIVDSVSVNELSDYAKVSGHPKIERIARAHNLNIRRVARKVAKELDKEFNQINMIGIHMGGGISVIAIEKGKFTDVNNALLGEGPFTTERAGTLPLDGVIDMCFEEGMTKAKMRKEYTKHSGLIAYLGTNDLREIEDRVIAGDKKAEFYLMAMAYRVAKSIGAMAAVMDGKVEAIFLTGGMARCPQLVERITKKTSFIAPVFNYAGQFEMIALAEGVERALNGKENIYDYKGV
ncbi:butyrate kinase [bacterium]|nr:butyrate kinase [bacterium]